MAKSMADANSTVQEAVQSSQGIWANPPNPPPPPPTGFDRAPKPNVIKCNVQGNVLFQKTKVETFFKGLLESKGLDAPFTVGGRALERRFNLTFTGPAAEEVVLCLLRARKDEAGDWVDAYVSCPEGSLLKLYFSGDQSAKSGKTERIAKRFSRYLESKYVGKEFRPIFGIGGVSVGGQRLAKFSIEPEVAKVSWNTSVATYHEIDIATDSAHFDRTFNIQWSS